MQRKAEANALRDELDLLESTRDEQPDLFTLDDKKRIDEINELLEDAPADTRYEDYEFSIVSDGEAAEIRRRAEADGTFMRAPNGNPTNLTERQWLQVRTRAFKEWFGDWELANLYNRALEAWNNKESKGKVSFGLSDRAKARFTELLGKDIKQLVITDDAIRHIKNKHSDRASCRAEYRHDGCRDVGGKHRRVSRQRKSVGQKPRGLVHGREPSDDGIEVVRKTDAVDFLLRQRADAVGLEQVAHLVEPDFPLYVVRIEHTEILPCKGTKKRTHIVRPSIADCCYGII